jgi:glycosyltransferase involved in cell wall biosynthesis
MKLKIAIVVHGRFHAFHLGRELINQGHNVTLFTNYPKSVVSRFGIPKERVVTFLFHGLLSRFLHFFEENLSMDFREFTQTLFSKWAAKKLAVEGWDVIYSFSGVAEEIFKSISKGHTLYFLVRGSSHIRTQAKLLEEEERRAGVPIDRPKAWIVAREEREYELADAVAVLSTFAKRSFLEEGFPENKLRLLPLGAQLSHFRPSENVIEDRCQRIVTGQPLRVLMVGTFSFRKGAVDFLKIAESLKGTCMFRFVGKLENEVKHHFSGDQSNIEFIPRQPEFNLPSFYKWADIFLFTTIEDGFAVVLAQAQASGLPILTTTNCSGSDIIREGQTGWVLPIRDPQAFVDRLCWCDAHRSELAQMVRATYEHFKPRDWSDVADDFVSICHCLSKKDLNIETNAEQSKE